MEPLFFSVQIFFVADFIQSKPRWPGKRVNLKDYPPVWREKRFLCDAQALRNRVENGRLKKPELIERAIGSLNKKHSRCARFYTLEHRDQTLGIDWCRAFEPVKTEVKTEPTL